MEIKFLPSWRKGDLDKNRWGSCSSQLAVMGLGVLGAEEDSEAGAGRKSGRWSNPEVSRGRKFRERGDCLMGQGSYK